MAARENLIELCKKIGHGHVEIDENCGEYHLFEKWITDEQIEVLMGMELFTPMTAEVVSENTGIPEAKCLEELRKLADIGVLLNTEAMGLEVYVLMTFAPGVYEFMLVNGDFCDKHPEVPVAFFEHAFRSQIGIIEDIPMGAGVMRAVPIEKAIPAETEQVKYEKLSTFIDRDADHIAVVPCQCRRVRRYMGEGSGSLEAGLCIFLGQGADMFINNGRGKKISLEECYELLEHCEKIGCVHQVTTLSAKGTVAICNCHPDTCLALGATQYFNAPDASRSNYVAEIDAANCVACGKCVEYCPMNTLKLGQKVCTKNPIERPLMELPFDTEWTKDRWNPDYRENRENVVETGTAPCKTACPAHIAVQGYIKKASQGKYLEALEVIKRENPFPAICGRICPHDCESECTRGDIDEAIAIDEIKKFIADQELHAATRFIPEKLHDYGKSIAVIGSGPAGLSCAYYLAADGYKVTVFEKESRPGGMMTLGIPAFRLERDVVDAEIDVLRQMGVTFKCGVEVGKDVTLDALRKEGFEAFYVAIGAQGGRKLGIEGEDAQGVIAGVDFLRNVALGKPEKLSGNVVVIGGGNVAVDVARTAIRVGAAATTMYCLESAEEMPALPEEQEEAKAEGIGICNGWGPKRIIVEGGKVNGVEFKKCVSVFENGNFAPKYDENDTITVPADFVVLSVGQSIEWGGLLDGSNVTLGRGNTAVADSLTYQTGQPDVFVGGDVYTGPKFAIDAIAAGKEGANSIHRFVWEGQSQTIGRNRRVFKSLDKENLDKEAIKAEGFDATKRQRPFHEAKKAKTFSDDRLTFTEEQMKAETNRCLGCGAVTIDPGRCLGCGVCTVMCTFDAIHLKKNNFVSNVPFMDRDEIFPQYKEERKQRIAVKKAAAK